jgi:mono/diheme cytochrome c family protein
MTRVLLSLSLALAAAAGLTLAPAGAQSTGVYSAAQAATGAGAYAASCAACHGVHLEGIAGPSLAGDAFLARWTGKTASDLNDFVSALMPQDNPGSLKPDEYLALLAFILQQNKYPAGPSALTAAKLKTVKLAKQK